MNKREKLKWALTIIALIQFSIFMYVILFNPIRNRAFWEIMIIVFIINFIIQLILDPEMPY